MVASGFVTITSTMDVRPGDVWRFVMHGPDGRHKIGYLELIRSKRLDYRRGSENVEPVSLEVRVKFEEDEGNIRLTTRMRFPSAAERDRVVKGI